MAHKIEFQNQLLAKNETEIGLAQQLIQESVVLLYQLVKDVLQDGAHRGHFEVLKAPLALHFFVHAVIESRIFHIAHSCRVFERPSELAHDSVASVDYKLEVCAATLLTKEEDEFVVEAEPVEKLDSGSDKEHVLVLAFLGGLVEQHIVLILLLVLLLLNLVCKVVFPDNLENADE